MLHVSLEIFICRQFLQELFQSWGRLMMENHGTLASNYPAQSHTQMLKWMYMCTHSHPHGHEHPIVIVTSRWVMPHTC